MKYKKTINISSDSYLLHYHLSHLLKERRLQLNMTQKQVAVKAELTQITVSNYEQPHIRTHTLDSLIKICRALEMNIGNLIMEAWGLAIPKTSISSSPRDLCISCEHTHESLKDWAHCEHKPVQP